MRDGSFSLLWRNHIFGMCGRNKHFTHINNKETRKTTFGPNGKTKKILLNGFYGASRFDFQIQLTRFLPKDANIIDITISYGDSSLLVVFLPRVYTPKDKHRSPLLTVDTKTGETSSKRITFHPSTYNPLIGWIYDEEVEAFMF